MSGDRIFGVGPMGEATDKTKPHYRQGRAESVFDRGLSNRKTSAQQLGFGNIVPTFGSFRNRVHSGTPIPFGERPADRPMAEALGNGLSYASATDHNGGRAKHLDSIGPTFGLVRPSDPTYFRKATGLKLFSWEQSDA